ncbi:hypothetical protein G9A89_008023 [Geosiphon pyriformis]|nr:hypothetical protein G9A89_008023 [Geosiphon pyriformis]
MNFQIDWSNVCDAHCHPHDDRNNLEKIGSLRIARLCIMGTRFDDLDVVSQLGSDFPEKVIPCFGYHPWFAHTLSFEKDPQVKSHYLSILQNQTSQEYRDEFLINSLPKPILINTWLEKLESLLKEDKRAIVGEIGIDRSARLIHPMTHSITKVQTTLQHQLAVFESQMDIAAKYQRPVSIHCVQATGPITELIQRKIKEGKAPPRICIHSFGGSIDTIKNLTKKPSKRESKKKAHTLNVGFSTECDIYFSFSIVINERNERLRELIRAVPEDKLLIETDMNSPEGMDSMMQQIIELVSNAKGWQISETVENTKSNFLKFVGEKDNSKRI